MNLPNEFTKRMSALLGDEYTDFLASYADSPLVGVRTNTLKLPPEALRKRLPGLEPVPWCAEGFYSVSGLRLGKSPYYHAGLYYIQEPSAMAPAAVMDVSPGMRVLDLCAAPGGKSTQLAARLGNTGVLVSNDISPSRARALLRNIELCSVTNCVVTAEAPARLAAVFGGYFDRILVDAPCSGEGMFRRDPDARAAWSVRKPSACLPLQRESLHYAAMMLKPGGRIMYSTCTFAPEEDELMVAGFLSEHSDFAGVDITKHGLAPGIYNEPYTARIWPHRHRGEGHFLAYLEKSDACAENGSCEDKHEASRKRLFFAEYENFCNTFLNFTPGGALNHERSLYLPPPELPELKGIRLLRCGLYLGDVLTKRFEPSQAFAMTLGSEDVKNNIDFKISDEGLMRYLKGESFEIPCADGWCLVTLEGFPLGWAKAAGGRIKNKYLKGWLMK